MTVSSSQDLLAEYDRKREAKAAAALALASAQAALDKAMSGVDTIERVRAFFVTLSEEQRRILEEKIESLVDYGVQAVFGPTHRFRVKSELRGKTVKTEFFLVEDGLELSILDSAGGGIADVVSFLLRVVMLCMSKPEQHRVLVLDEPFKFVSTTHFQPLNTLLRELSESLNLQLIMVTHKPELMDAATTLVRVSKVRGKSKLEVQEVR